MRHLFYGVLHQLTSIKFFFPIFTKEKKGFFFLFKSFETQRNVLKYNENVYKTDRCFFLRGEFIWNFISLYMLNQYSVALTKLLKFISILNVFYLNDLVSVFFFSFALVFGGIKSVFVL